MDFDPKVLEEAVRVATATGPGLDIASVELADPGDPTGAVVFRGKDGNVTGMMNGDDYRALGRRRQDAQALTPERMRDICLERRKSHATAGDAEQYAFSVFVNSHRFRARSSFDRKVWLFSRKHNESGNAREAER